MENTETTTTNINMSPMQWAPLKDIDDVEPLNEKDTPVLKDLYAVLEKHGYLDRFGITLIHKHFEIADDEILLETTDEKNRVLTMRTVKEAAPENQGSTQTMWKLQKGGDYQTMARCFASCETNIHGNHSRFHNYG